MKILKVVLQDKITTYEVDFNSVSFEVWGVKFYENKAGNTLYIPWTNIEYCQMFNS